MLERLGIPLQGLLGLDLNITCGQSRVNIAMPAIESQLGNDCKA